MKKILIVENDIDTLDIMEYLFSDCGFEVEKFIDIIPVAQIVKIEPGVVLLDHFLTTGYGADLCQE